jgi:hypothetical protein
MIVFLFGFQILDFLCLPQKRTVFQNLGVGIKSQPLCLAFHRFCFVCMSLSFAMVPFTFSFEKSNESCPAAPILTRLMKHLLEGHP